MGRLDELISALIEDTHRLDERQKVIPASVYSAIILLRASERMYHELDEYRYTEGQKDWDSVFNTTKEG